MFKGLNWVGVIAGLIFGQALSYVWYNMAFGAVERSLYASPASANPALYGVAAVLALLILIGLAWVIHGMGQESWGKGLKTGVLFWIFFMLTTELMRPIYMGEPVKQVEIDLGYELIFLSVAGALIGGLRFGRKAS